MSVVFEVSQDEMLPYRAAARDASLHQAFTFNCMVLQLPVAEPEEPANMAVVCLPLVSQQSCMLKASAFQNMYGMVVANITFIAFVQIINQSICPRLKEENKCLKKNLVMLNMNIK